MKTPDVKAQYDRAAAHLTQLREEIRLEVKLAGMEAQSAWELLETRFKELERRARTEVTDASHAAANELAVQFSAFRATLKKAQEKVAERLQ